MLLFSTLLPVKNSLTPDDFIRLVLEWNATHSFEENKIPGIVWNGERSVRYGDDTRWLAFEELPEEDILAVRFEKVADNGAVWDTEYVVNFRERKISVRLERSFLAEALEIDPNFSTPYFITLLAKNGYLDDDGDLPISVKPVWLSINQRDVLKKLVRGEVPYALPVVYVSALADGKKLLDINHLAFQLKGIAHVVAAGYELQPRLVGEPIGGLEKDGAIGVYYPNSAVRHRSHSSQNASYLFARIFKLVMEYAIVQNVDPLYTWQGVSNVVLRGKLAQKVASLEVAERERRQAEAAKEESNLLIDSVDQELRDLDRRVIELTRENEMLRAEATGLRNRLQSIGLHPLLRYGQEYDFFPDEIKDMVLSVLAEECKNRPQLHCRRYDVLQDILNDNEYKRIIEDKAAELRVRFKGYRTMDARLRSSLEELGFTITSDGKHYKLVYKNDARYNCTLPKSGSDVRGGLNAASDIIATIF